MFLFFIFIKAVFNLSHACEVDGIRHYCRYYADIRQTISASDQEMNSALAELSRVSTATRQSFTVWTNTDADAD